MKSRPPCQVSGLKLQGVANANDNVVAEILYGAVRRCASIADGVEGPCKSGADVGACGLLECTGSAAQGLVDLAVGGDSTEEEQLQEVQRNTPPSPPHQFSPTTVRAFTLATMFTTVCIALPISA